MFQAIFINNPFEPQRDLERGLHESGGTILDFLRERYGEGFNKFETPHLIQLNGMPVVAPEEEGNVEANEARQEALKACPDAPTWETTLKDGDVLAISPIPGEIVTAIIYIVVAIVVSVVVTLALSDPAVPTDQGTQGDTVYNLKGQTNQFRLGDPVECHYGECRIFPSYAAPPFNQYTENKQYQTSLFCVGLGEYDIEDVYIEDTPIDSFDDVTYEIVPPGAALSLWPDNVVTSVEVNGIELFGANEEDYPAGGGWFGGFIVNPAGTTIDRIEVDVNFPQGLVNLYQGLRYQTSVEVEFQAREVDENGDAVGDWETVINETIARRTNTPQRVTLGADVEAGRWEVRGRRVGDKNQSVQVYSLTQWETLRGFSPSSTRYPKTTMLVVKALASNNLNNNTRSRINVYATRKLPIWDDETGWSEPTATRNPVWAFCDVFRADYGGKLDADYLDLVSLLELAGVFTSRGDYFDGTFDNGSTVWEAARAIARVGRAAPIPQGSRITMIRDTPQTLPAALFNQENIVKGSFREELEIFEFNGFDSLLVEYTDPVTWKPLQVLCQLPGETADNPDTLKLFGCTSRAQAYREGMYILACRRYQRTNYIFDTGLEGHIPTFLDMVGFSMDTIKGPRSGMVLDYDSETNIMTLSERVAFADGWQHVICLRDSEGAAMAPINVTAGETSNKVVLASDPPEELGFSKDQVPPLYFFGIADVYAIAGKVVEISPNGDEGVSLQLVNYDPRVYSFDSFPVPPLVESSGIVDPDSPEVESIVINVLPDKPEFVIVSWKPAFGALGYVVERTFDVPVDSSSNWETIGETAWNVTTVEVPVVPGDTVVRVSAKGRGGRWGRYWRNSVVTTVGIEGNPPAAVALNPTQEDFTGLGASVEWQPVADAVGYSVSVWKVGGGASLRDVDVLNALEFEYTSTMMGEDSANPSRDLELRVYAYNSAGPSDATVRTVNNPKPATVTTPAAVLDSGSTYDFTWDAIAGPPADFAFYRLYGSTTPGFTPGAGNLLYEGTDAFTSLVVGATPFYWRVAAFDVWASSHADANFTAEQEIS